MKVVGHKNIRTMAPESAATIDGTTVVDIVTDMGRFEVREQDDGALVVRHCGWTERGKSDSRARICAVPEGTGSLVLTPLPPTFTGQERDALAGFVEQAEDASDSEDGFWQGLLRKLGGKPTRRKADK